MTPTRLKSKEIPCVNAPGSASKLTAWRLCTTRRPPCTICAESMHYCQRSACTFSAVYSRSAGSASGKHIFDTFTAVSLVGHQEIRQLRMELLTLRTAQSAQEKDDFSAGARVHFARFPIVGGKVSAANRTTQRLRPRNNKNSFSHFLVKLDTITTLQ